MILRTNDESYKKFVEKWYSVVMPKLRPLLYSNGGPIITVQVENEYGSYFACDHDYLLWLRDVIKRYLVDDVQLFSVDLFDDHNLACGKIPGVYATVDFGTTTDPKFAFDIQKRTEPKGPSVNSEFYTGWIDHWSEGHQTVCTPAITNQLDTMLSLNASVNL